MHFYYHIVRPTPKSCLSRHLTSRLFTRLLKGRGIFCTEGSVVEVVICHRCEYSSYDVFGCPHDMTMEHPPEIEGKAVVFTGHRPSSLPGGWNELHPANVSLKTLLGRIVAKAYDCGFRWVIVGGALGVDMWVAEATLELRDSTCPDLRLYVAIPHLEHWKAWQSQSLLERYWKIRQEADIVHIVTPKLYAPRLMQLRNMHMVDRANVLVAVWNGKKEGGTYNCIRYAQTCKHIKVHVVNPSTLEVKPLNR